jgi:ubiquinone biosynthesis protein COQ9
MPSHATHILEAALPHIVFDGWTDAVLKRAAAEIGLSEFECNRVFPNGVADALAMWSETADAAMVVAFAQETAENKLKIREKIALLCMLRFRQHAGNREAVRRAVAWVNLPWNSPHGLRALYKTVDAMWHAAGDTATDWNFYTKRALLAKVYGSSLYVWLNDTSEDLVETEAFLRRRIENVMQIEKAKAKAKTSLDSLANWFPKPNTSR